MGESDRTSPLYWPGTDHDSDVYVTEVELNEMLRVSGVSIRPHKIIGLGHTFIGILYTVGNCFFCMCVHRAAI